MEAYTTNAIGEDGITVAELAISHPGALAVFTKYNMDYCCGGQRSLKEACHRLGLDPKKIRAEIYDAPQHASGIHFHPETWSSALLIDYIVENHHAYVLKAIPELELLLDRVCERHGDERRELPEIRENFYELATELVSHLRKEESILFPAIKTLEREMEEGTPLYLDTPVAAMEHEHATAGDLIKQIRSLTNNYTPPEFACTTFKITFQRLQEFDNDLMQHIHLENNILFRRFKAA